MFLKRFKCHCCCEWFFTDKPQDLQRDIGYGTCEACHNMIAEDRAKWGYAGKKVTLAEALLHLKTHA